MVLFVGLDNITSAYNLWALNDKYMVNNIRAHNRNRKFLIFSIISFIYEINNCIDNINKFNVLHLFILKKHKIKKLSTFKKLIENNLSEIRNATTHLADYNKNYIDIITALEKYLDSNKRLYIAHIREKAYASCYTLSNELFEKQKDFDWKNIFKIMLKLTTEIPEISYKLFIVFLKKSKIKYKITKHQNLIDNNLI